MHKIKQIVFVFFVSMLTGVASFAQTEGQHQLNLLKAPASPAAHILNFATSSIDRPTDLTAFWLTANNLTGNFTRLPNSYAIEIAPSIAFKTGINSLKNLRSTKFSEVVSQTFVLSAGFKLFDDTVTATSYYKTAIGFKFMLARPKWSAETNAKYKALIALQEKLTDNVGAISDSVDAMPEIKKLLEDRRKALDSPGGKTSEAYKTANAEYLEMRSAMREKVSKEKNNLLHQLIKEKAKDFTIERVGFFAELAGGLGVAFPTNDFNYSIGDKAGVWLTAGHEGGNDKMSALFLARYLYQPEKIFADSTGKIPTKRISTFDMGGRFIYTSPDGKISVSAEAIYRSVLNKSVIDPSWRTVFNAGYQLGSNHQLTFTFGRDFNGVVEKGGTLVAGINYLIGLGGQRMLN